MSGLPPPVLPCADRDILGGFISSGDGGARRVQGGQRESTESPD